ncbi:MAG: hypothetical protein KKG47_00320 [Proteobacteria bacterium]|nr:hypothetical protein [Pseudomonadota bacterium]MBU1737182.1 hypothetical protein [Pseudomonadota bacterium]
MSGRTLFILAALLFTACAPAGNNIVSLMVKTGESSIDYRQGYLDGCGSGRAAKGDANHIHFKDLTRYNGAYRQGWDDAFALCGQP